MLGLRGRRLSSRRLPNGRGADMEAKGLLRKANVLAVDDQPANLVALDAVLGADY